MAQVAVRDVEEAVEQRLKQRASGHGRSMEEEVREILRDAVHEVGKAPIGLGSRIALRFSGHGLDVELPEFCATTRTRG